MVIPGYAFPIGSQDFYEIAKLARKHMFVYFHPMPPFVDSTNPSTVPAPRDPHTIQSLEVDEVISYTLPGSSEILECTVIDIGTSRVKGSWFRVVHAKNPGVEVELSAWEMKELLTRRAN